MKCQDQLYNLQYEVSCGFNWGQLREQWMCLNSLTPKIGFSPLVAMIPCKFVMIIWCWINIISHSGPI